MGDPETCRPMRANGQPCEACRPKILEILDARIAEADRLAQARNAERKPLERGHWEQIGLYLRDMRRVIAS